MSPTDIPVVYTAAKWAVKIASLVWFSFKNVVRVINICFLCGTKMPRTVDVTICHNVMTT